MTPKVLPEALIEELLAAAGKATPGPWDTDEPHIVYAGNGEDLGDNVRYLANTKDLDTDYKEAKANAAFIARANPLTISALIAEVKAARAAERDLKTALAHIVNLVHLYEDQHPGHLFDGHLDAPQVKAARAFALGYHERRVAREDDIEESNGSAFADAIGGGFDHR